MNNDWKVDVVKDVAFAVLAVAIVMAVTVAIHWDYEARKERPVVMEQENARNPKRVEEQLRVTPVESRVITREIQRSSDTPPAVTYYVQAPTLEKAADETAKAIENQSPALPPAAAKKSDRTIVTADNKLNKVDVYKISLRKVHKVKTGFLFTDGKVYPSVGYQAGRWEGTLHFDGQAVKGGTIMYTAIQW